MKYKYGNFSDAQISELKTYIRKQIFFLLLIVDPKTKDDYLHIDTKNAFQNVLKKIGGLNSLLSYPNQFPVIMTLLESALLEFNSDEFDFKKYRKLLLDAGAEVEKIKENEEVE